MWVRGNCVVSHFRIQLPPYTVSIKPESMLKLFRTLDDLGFDTFVEEDLSRDAFPMQLKSQARKPNPLPNQLRRLYPSFDRFIHAVNMRGHRFYLWKNLIHSCSCRLALKH